MGARTATRRRRPSPQTGQRSMSRPVRRSMRSCTGTRAGRAAARAAPRARGTAQEPRAVGGWRASRNGGCGRSRRERCGARKGAKDIAVVGGGNSAVEEGLHLTTFAEKVTLLVRGDRLTASQIAVDKVNEPTSRVEVKYNVVVDAFEGQDSKLKTIRYHDRDGGAMKEIHPAAVFIFIGQQPNTAFLNGYAEMDKYGFVLTGHDLTPHAHGSHKPLPVESSVPGVFAAGDARHDSTKQVASAVGEGAASAIAIREFLKKAG